MTTHHWQWSIEIINDFRNSVARIEHRYYSPLAFFFEAFWVAGPQPKRIGHEDYIRIIFNGKEVGAFKDKEGAIKCVEKIIESAPKSCADYSRQEWWVISDGIFGRNSAKGVANET